MDIKEGSKFDFYSSFFLNGDCKLKEDAAFSPPTLSIPGNVWGLTWVFSRCSKPNVTRVPFWVVFCTCLVMSRVIKVSFPQIVTNVKNTLHGFKKLHGRAFEDSYIQAERARLPYELQKMPNGSVGVKVSLCRISSVVEMSTFDLCHLTSYLN